MTVESQQTEDIVDEVTRWLSGEFSKSLPDDTIGAIVRTARHDLEGQIVPEALGEMLHRLARFRVLRILEKR